MPASRPRPLPIRLRYVLLGACVAGGLAWVWPRMEANWRLHAVGTVFGNYAACMAGPTGPGLLRDAPAEFRALVRRRLITAEPLERPFVRCAPLAKELAVLVEESARAVALERTHGAEARAFVEYGSEAADRAKEKTTGLSLATLEVSTESLRELGERARPLLRGGYRRLLTPTRGAFEAVHPVELPRPGAGRGLPAWRAHYRSVRPLSDTEFLLAFGSAANLSGHRTRDAGITWAVEDTRHPAVADVSERCGAEHGRAFVLARDESRGDYLVTSFGPDAPASTYALGAGAADVIGVACDETGLSAALKAESSDRVVLKWCPYQRGCADLPLPRDEARAELFRYPLDLARSGGATVVAVARHGIVRVTSSRDGGRSWTPFAVAFDAGAEPRQHVLVPDRLLALGRRVLLYGSSDQRNGTYPVLVSFDQGASFRTPETEKPPTRAIAAR